jgi:hypothetical protein
LVVSCPASANASICFSYANIQVSFILDDGHFEMFLNEGQVSLLRKSKIVPSESLFKKGDMTGLEKLYFQ